MELFLSAHFTHPDMPSPSFLRTTTLLFAAIVLASACSDDKKTPLEPTGPGDPATVTVNLREGRDTIAFGGTTSLGAVVRDADGDSIGNATVAWESSDPTVAQVSSAGVVTATGLGVVDIKASVNSISGTRRIVVSRTANGPGWIAVSVASGHTCALHSTGNAYCWGDNVVGMIGDGTTTLTSVPTAVVMPAGVRFTAVATATRSSCGLAENGDAYCWGDNVNNGIGSATAIKSLTPLKVDAPSGVTFRQLAAGSAHVCALATNGDAYCWGLNSQGALGSGTTGNSPIPIRVAAANGISFTSIASSGNAVCAIAVGGAVYCWGFNDSGQLGNGNAETSRVPVAALLPSGARTLISAGTGFHFCAITPTDALFCWGRNIGGQFGNGAKDFENNTPVAITLPANFKPIGGGAGSSSTCLVNSSYQVYCIGSGTRGQLGTGNTAESLVPARVLTPESSRHDIVRAASSTACALSLTGQIHCWGAGTSGQIGNGERNDASTPVSVVVP